MISVTYESSGHTRQNKKKCGIVRTVKSSQLLEVETQTCFEFQAGQSTALDFVKCLISRTGKQDRHQLQKQSQDDDNIA